MARKENEAARRSTKSVNPDPASFKRMQPLNANPASQDRTTPVRYKRQLSDREKENDLYERQGI
jgi:hypothetical protein